jgi:hypothetical protein
MDITFNNDPIVGGDNSNPGLGGDLNVLSQKKPDAWINVGESNEEEIGVGEVSAGYVTPDFASDLCYHAAASTTTAVQQPASHVDDPEDLNLGMNVLKDCEN